MITLLIEGQTLQFPEEVAVNDDALRRAIAPLFPQAANARFERTSDEQGQTVIKITKQAGTKGGPIEAILRALRDSPRHVNPALTLSRTLERTDKTRMTHEDLLHLERHLHSTITTAEEELKSTHAILTHLIDAPAIAATKPPIGF